MLIFLEPCHQSCFCFLWDPILTFGAAFTGAPAEVLAPIWSSRTPFLKVAKFSFA
jgi:hypothetical protein